DPHRGRRPLRRPRRRAARPRDPDRPRRLLLRHPARPRDRGLAVGGVRARRCPHRHHAARGRPVRGTHRGAPVTLSLAALAALLPSETLTPSPSPSDVLRPGLDPYVVSPGLLGFLAIFAVASVCVLGWLSLNRKVRRMRFAERAEGVETDGAAPAGGPGTTAPGGTAPGTSEPGASEPGASEPGGEAGPAAPGAAGDDARG